MTLDDALVKNVGEDYEVATAYARVSREEIKQEEEEIKQKA